MAEAACRVELLFIDALCGCGDFYLVLLSVFYTLCPSSFAIAIILMGKREAIALL